jgi:hypothetical protein
LRRAGRVANKGWKIALATAGPPLRWTVRCVGRHGGCKYCDPDGIYKHVTSPRPGADIGDIVAIYIFGPLGSQRKSSRDKEIL